MLEQKSTAFEARGCSDAGEHEKDSRTQQVGGWQHDQGGQDPQALQNSAGQEQLDPEGYNSEVSVKVAEKGSQLIGQVFARRHRFYCCGLELVIDDPAYHAAQNHHSRDQQEIPGSGNPAYALDQTGPGLFFIGCRLPYGRDAQAWETAGQ